MWSLDGDTLIFPKEVSLTVGNNSNIRHLVLQVHYISKDNIPETGDTSGLVVEYQTEQTEFAAGEVRLSLFSLSWCPGIVSLHVHGSLPPNSLTYWDSACRLLGSAGYSNIQSYIAKSFV